MLVMKKIMQSALLPYLIHKFSKLAQAITQKITKEKLSQPKETDAVSTKTIIIIDEDEEKSSLKISRYENGLEKEKLIYEKAIDDSANEVSLPPNPLRRHAMNLN
jgi:hypothetical protein